MSRHEKSMELLDRFLEENEEGSIIEILTKINNQNFNGLPLLEYFQAIESEFDLEEIFNSDRFVYSESLTLKAINRHILENEIGNLVEQNSNNQLYAMAA